MSLCHSEILKNNSEILEMGFGRFRVQFGSGFGSVFGSFQDTIECSVSVGIWFSSGFLFVLEFGSV